MRDLIQCEALHHAIPAAALAKEGKDLVLAALVENRLETPGAAHVQAVPPYLQPGNPAGGHAWHARLQRGGLLCLTSALAGH